MRILFIRPKPSPVTIGLQHLMVVEPLELEVMAALTAPTDEVMIVDMILEDRPVEYFIRNFDPDLFCITGYITHVPVMIEYCTLAKEINPRIITIAGGVHIEKCPGDCDHESIDYRIARNATRTFPQLLKYLKNGDATEFPQGALRKDETNDPEKLPPFDFYFPNHPRRDLTLRYRKNYFYVFHDHVALVKTSFGCPYKCNFCFCRMITDDHYHERPLDEVLDELEQIREKEIYIVDDNFLFSPRRIREFIDELKRRKIRKRFLVYGRADFIANNPILVRDFRKVGLRTVIIGLESFNDTELSGYNKQLVYQANREAMEVLNANRVDCYAAIILAPSWHDHDFIELRKGLRDLKIRFVNLQPLTPLPETGVLVDEKNLIIGRTDYPYWDLAHVTIRPENMTIQEYYRNIMQTYISTLFQWNYITSYLKYPPHLHLRMLKGVYRVYRQYKAISKESMKYA